MEEEKIKTAGEGRGLEGKLQQEPAASQSSGAQSAYETMDEEQLIKLFRQRYENEEKFRELVLEEMKIGKGRRAKLKIKSWIAPSSYKNETEGIVHTYVERVKNALELQKLAREAGEKRKILEKKASEITSVQAKMAQRQEQYQQIVGRIETEKQSIEQQFTSLTEAERRALEEKKKEVARETDERAIVESQLKKCLTESPYVLKTADGRLDFNSDALMKMLEEDALHEILEGEGGSGFMAKIRLTYDGVINHWDEMEDWDEMPRVDWVQSIISARMQGFRYPVLIGHYVTGKTESQTRVGITTRIVIDMSKSMEDYGRWEPAKKTGFALNALMRKLNPINKTGLGVFSNDVRDITPLELYKGNIIPIGATAMDKALNWLADGLEGGGPGMGYLLTDGHPEGEGDILGRTYKAAARFKNNPQIQLRIFAIEVGEEKKKILKQIASRAGPNTRIIPVEKNRMGIQIIRETNYAIGKMMRLNDYA